MTALCETYSFGNNSFGLIKVGSGAPSCRSLHVSASVYNAIWEPSLHGLAVNTGTLGTLAATTR